LFLKGRGLFEVQEFCRAREFFEKVLELDAENKDAKTWIEKSTLSQKKYFDKKEKLCKAMFS